VKVAFIVGLCASIAANVAGAQPTLGGRLIAARPAVALLLIVEMLVYTRPCPAQHTAHDERDGAAPLSFSPAPAPAPPRPFDAAKHHPEPHHKFHPEPDHMFHLGHQPPTGRRRRPITVTRQLAADILAAEPDLTREQIAARLGVSTRRLRTVLASAPNGTRSPSN
jgi:hypothetical protein